MCGTVAGKVCGECSLDAHAGMVLDEVRDVLAWRVLTDTWDTLSATIQPGLADKVGFRLFAEADAAAIQDETTRPKPSSTRFAYVDPDLLRARLTPAVEARPPEPERCPIHGCFMSQGTSQGFTGAVMRSIDWKQMLSFCKQCLREENERAEPIVSHPEHKWPQPVSPEAHRQSVVDRLVEKVRR